MIYVPRIGRGLNIPFKGYTTIDVYPIYMPDIENIRIDKLDQGLSLR